MVTQDVLNRSFICSFIHSTNMMESIGNRARHWCLSDILFSPASKDYRTKTWVCIALSPRETKKSGHLLSLFLSCKWKSDTRYAPTSCRPCLTGRTKSFDPKGWFLSLAKSDLSLLGVPVRVTPMSGGVGRTTPHSFIPWAPIRPYAGTSVLPKTTLSPCSFKEAHSSFQQHQTLEQNPMLIVQASYEKLDSAVPDKKSRLGDLYHVTKASEKVVRIKDNINHLFKVHFFLFTRFLHAEYSSSIKSK